jgi:phage/plasmid-like protein (TIGR03299 family)
MPTRNFRNSKTQPALDGGKKVFICLKIDKSLTIMDNDKIDQYLLIVSSHDGSMSITATETPIRVVCNNTLTAALRGAKGAIKIRHTSTASDRLKEAMKVLNMLDDNADILTEQFSTMADTIISPAQMFDYFGSVFCTPEEIKEFQTGKSAKQVLSAQKQNILTDVSLFAGAGIGQLQTFKNGTPTLWTAYNAVTGYVTHKKKFQTANDKANSMLFGSSADLIKDAGILAAEPVKIQSLRKSGFDSSQLN